MYRIAISGKAKVGKNTVASLLLDKAGIQTNAYRMRAFADPMKQIAEIMFPMIDRNSLYGESELRSNIIHKDYHDINGNPLTVRQFLLDIGKFGRQYSSKAWINCLEYDFNQTISANKDIVYLTPDLRFIDEYEFLASLGFILIRVKRKNFSKINDISEVEQESISDSKFHFVIDNDFSKDELAARVDEIIESIG